MSQHTCLCVSMVLAVVMVMWADAKVYRSFLDKYSSNHKYVPRSLGSYLIPLEDLLLDLAGYTGHTMGKVPKIMRGIKHEMYIAKHNRDPLLHEILRRYGFNYSGQPMGGIGGMGRIGGGTQDILNSLGVGGVGGVSSVQTPLPGINNRVNDDLFDEFDSGVLGLNK
ncbi:hypothetical protein PoB_003865500 [Plakobranchus ocellatus]|uniref:Uncharacterized protein n=1 Tax=Plakobranchus ocellatus TaxID=259542 RepID=A0AAV4AZA8_9GAST|nr:hypothetical protein PoB_003865500 [Plakobranchus ocellatus]